MAVAETHAASHDQHGHGHHDHAEFIAHHFDSAEQQFDSGKLGIWLFLVTEVLFFSGLFVAYTLYRNHHPEIFDQAHIYLDKMLGGINTVVLLFSSLTMALGVRAAQLGRNKTCSIFVLITMVCAAVFLGVKAVEYSHKWDMGIFPRQAFHLKEHASPTTAIGQALNISDYLVYLSIIPTVLAGLFIVGAGFGYANKRPNLGKMCIALLITVGGYFLGAVGGRVYQHFAEGEHHAESHDHDHKNSETEKHDGHASVQTVVLHAATAGFPGGEDAKPEKKLNRDIGIFFSIYYCMTGLHAIHILGGIGFLSWIYWRSILGHWRHDYFGPVDYVGLYWHLVDLIWIYLFPLLYLID